MKVDSIFYMSKSYRVSSEDFHSFFSFLNSLDSFGIRLTGPLDCIPENELQIKYSMYSVNENGEKLYCRSNYKVFSIFPDIIPKEDNDAMGVCSFGNGLTLMNDQIIELKTLFLISYFKKLNISDKIIQLAEKYYLTLLTNKTDKKNQLMSFISNREFFDIKSILSDDYE